MENLDKSVERRENRRNQWGFYERDRLISLLVVRPQFLNRERNMSVGSLVPDINVLLALEPAEVGAVMLQYLNGLPPNEAWSFTR
jgi:hypothetical protein